MTNTPRTRTRQRPASHSDTEESRIAGSSTSERSTEDHKPTKSVSVFNLPDGCIARVSVRDGVTLNMGNYNSFRREIGLDLDIPLTMDSPVTDDGDLTDKARNVVDAVYDNIQGWVSDKLDDCVADATEYFGD